MRVDKIYLDTKEQKSEQKNGKTMRTLESDTFKEPLTMEVVFEEEEKRLFDSKIEEVNKVIVSQKENINTITKQIEEYKLAMEEQSLLLEKYKQTIEKLEKENKEKSDRYEALNNKLNWILSDVESAKWIIVQQWHSIRQIYLKQMEQPSVCSWNMFISWQEEVILSHIKVVEWDYLIIQKIEILEKNEYVTNQNDITFSKMHIWDSFDVKYRLIWTTSLDNPTATVKYTLVFMPI